MNKFKPGDSVRVKPENLKGKVEEVSKENHTLKTDHGDEVMGKPTWYKIAIPLNKPTGIIWAKESQIEKL